MEEKCELCQRENIVLTKHHACPKEEGGTVDDIIMICVDCHKQIHALYSNKELAIRLNNREALLQDEQLKRFLSFVRKQKSSKKIRHRRSLKR